MSSTINQVLQKWPQGTVALSRWLATQGVSKDLARIYVKSGWISSIGIGAYIRSGDTVDWQGGVYALQHRAQTRVWPGGLTALSIQGFAHYLPMGTETVRLFGAPGERLPKWFRCHDWGQIVKFLAPNLFSPTSLDVSAAKFGNFSIEVSSPERAVFELLYQVPQTYSFTFAAEVVEGLMILRPGLMQQLLESCRSVKVKRLVLFLAEFYRHAWLERIGLSNIDLGSGKRQIVAGGCLDKAYLITVPEEFSVGS